MRYELCRIAVNERCDILGGLFFLGSAVVDGGKGSSSGVQDFLLCTSYLWEKSSESNSVYGDSKLVLNPNMGVVVFDRPYPYYLLYTQRGRLNLRFP